MSSINEAKTLKIYFMWSEMNKNVKNNVKHSIKCNSTQK